MAQGEDTELRDLVIEALEKNGSLAKIRALLRANIFLAFEDECENFKNNINLDNMLKSPEGILSLSIVHEFLEFCNLKNTLFVYKAESRQGKEYNYEGKKALSEKLHIKGKDFTKEPTLVTLVQNILKPFRRKCYDQGDGNSMKYEQNGNYKDDQDCTYIVHDDSNSVTSNSQSDNSSDEKNKLHLRLQLDNSDTDTSSDSTRDKSSSEYIPNAHIVIQNTNRTENKTTSEDKIHIKNILVYDDRNQKTNTPHFLHDLKTLNNSSDSTSYVDLKTYNSLEEKMLNTTGIPHKDIVENDSVNIALPVQRSQPEKSSVVSKDVIPSTTLSSVSSITSNNEKGKIINNIDGVGKKSDPDSAEYSLDFTSSETSKSKDETGDQTHSLKSVQEDQMMNDSNIKLTESPNQKSNSSHSSVSISDVADLIEYSDKNSPVDKQKYYQTEKSLEHNESMESSRSNSKSTDMSKSIQKKFSIGDSGDFSISPVPSLSNLSLDIHSD